MDKDLLETHLTCLNTTAQTSATSLHREEKPIVTEQRCKICQSPDLTIFAHTAKCHSCGVLLFWPYPKDDMDAVIESFAKKWSREWVMSWYALD